MRISAHPFLTASLFVIGAALPMACKGPSNGSDGIKPYPLTECLVTDNELGSMGDPITIVYQGQEIKFCCDPCEEEFHADPEAFLTKLENAAK